MRKIEKPEKRLIEIFKNDKDFFICNKNIFKYNDAFVKTWFFFQCCCTFEVLQNFRWFFQGVYFFLRCVIILPFLSLSLSLFFHQNEWRSNIIFEKRKFSQISSLSGRNFLFFFFLRRAKSLVWQTQIAALVILSLVVSPWFKIPIVFFFFFKKLNEFFVNRTPGVIHYRSNWRFLKGFFTFFFSFLFNLTRFKMCLLLWPSSWTSTLSGILYVFH